MTGFALRPPPTGPAPILYVPGIGNRTTMVAGWNRPGQHVSAVVPTRPAAGAPLTERGAALAKLLAEHGVDDAVLVGHSLGALVAFEAVAALGGDRVALLVLVGQYPPHAMTRFGEDDLRDRVLPGLVAGLPGELRGNADFVDAVTEVWAADYRAAAAYETSATTGVPTVVVGARDDRLSRDEALLAEWDRHCTGQLRTRVVDGGHDFVEHLDGAGFAELLGACRR